MEAVGYLARMLLGTEHGGFPVVKYDHETRREYYYGLLTRYTINILKLQIPRLTGKFTALAGINRGA